MQRVERAERVANVEGVKDIERVERKKEVEIEGEDFEGKKLGYKSESRKFLLDVSK